MQQISTEGALDNTPLCGQRDSLGDVQKTEIWPYEQMVYAQTSSCPKKWHSNRT